MQLMLKPCAQFFFLATFPCLGGPTLSPEEAEVTPQLRLASMVPLHVPMHDFRLPLYDAETGKPSSIVEARLLYRVSDTRFALQDLKILLFEDGTQTCEITTRSARFDLRHKLLSGGDRVQMVCQGDNPLDGTTGRGFVYDLDTQVFSLLREVNTKLTFKKSRSP